MSPIDESNLLTRLQHWYQAQCDGDWEHQYGVHITTLDNPGWLVKIDLVGTPLGSMAFQTIREPANQPDFEQAERWLHCKVRDSVWEGAGDPDKLGRIIEVFLGWTETA